MPILEFQIEVDDKGSAVIKNFRQTADKEFDKVSDSARKHAGKTLKEWEESFKKIEKRMKRIGQAAKKAMIGFGILSAAMIASAIPAIQLQKEIAIVGTLLDRDTPKAIQKADKFLKKFTHSISEMSKEFGQSTATLSKGLFDIVSAVIPAEKALETLTAATELAIAGNTETGLTTKALIAIMKSYGDEVKDAADAANFLFLVQKRGITTVGAVAEQIGMVVSMAKMAGLSLEEMGAFIATATRATVPLDTAVTGLRNVLKAFINPTDQATAAAKELGLELSSAELQSKGLLAVAQRLSKASSEQAAAMFENIRALVPMSAVANDAAGFLEDINIQQERSTELQKAYNEVIKTASHQLKILKHTFVVLLEESWRPLLPWITKLVKSFANLIDMINKSFGPFKSIIAKVGLMTGVLGFLIAAIILVVAKLILLNAQLQFYIANSILATGASAKFALSLNRIIPLLGKAGLVAAAFAAGWAIGTYINKKLTEAIEKFEELEKAMGFLESYAVRDIEQVGKEIKLVEEELKEVIKTIDMLNKKTGQFGKLFKGKVKFWEAEKLALAHRLLQLDNELEILKDQKRIREVLAEGEAPPAFFEGPLREKELMKPLTEEERVKLEAIEAKKNADIMEQAWKDAKLAVKEYNKEQEILRQYDLDRLGAMADMHDISPDLEEDATKISREYFEQLGVLADMHDISQDLIVDKEKERRELKKLEEVWEDISDLISDTITTGMFDLLIEGSRTVKEIFTELWKDIAQKGLDIFSDAFIKPAVDTLTKGIKDALSAGGGGIGGIAKSIGGFLTSPGGMMAIGGLAIGGLMSLFKGQKAWWREFREEFGKIAEELRKAIDDARRVMEKIAEAQTEIRRSTMTEVGKFRDIIDETRGDWQNAINSMKKLWVSPGMEAGILEELKGFTRMLQNATKSLSELFEIQIDLWEQGKKIIETIRDEIEKLEESVGDLTKAQEKLNREFERRILDIEIEAGLIEPAEGLGIIFQQYQEMLEQARAAEGEERLKIVNELKNLLGDVYSMGQDLISVAQAGLGDFQEELRERLIRAGLSVIEINDVLGKQFTGGVRAADIAGVFGGGAEFSTKELGQWMVDQLEVLQGIGSDAYDQQVADAENEIELMRDQLEELFGVRDATEAIEAWNELMTARLDEISSSIKTVADAMEATARLLEWIEQNERVSLDVLKQLVEIMNKISDGILPPLIPAQHGISFVPKEMPALLHQGERVLTAAENRMFNSGMPKLVADSVEVTAKLLEPVQQNEMMTDEYFNQLSKDMVDIKNSILSLRNEEIIIENIIPQQDLGQEKTILETGAAKVHKGERVLTAAENRMFNSGIGMSDVNINLDFNITGDNPIEISREVASQLEDVLPDILKTLSAKGKIKFDEVSTFKRRV